MHGQTQMSSHKLTFKPGYHLYILLCHIFMYTGIYFCVADIYNEFLLVLIVSMKTQTDNYIIYNVIILD